MQASVSAVFLYMRMGLHLPTPGIVLDETRKEERGIMGPLRILVLAQNANPDSICGPLIGYSQAQALARLHDVTLIIGSSSEEAVRRRQGTLRAVEVIKLGWLDGIYAWSIDKIFKNNYNNQLLQVFVRPFSVVFEWQAWRQMQGRIKGGEFDIVLRLLPVSMISLSPFAFFLRNGPVPFLVGPVNGGLPWLQGFKQAKIQNKWVTRLRNLYSFLPFGRSTYRRAAAIMAGSSHTYAELSEHREKLFFLPENGIESSMCARTLRSRQPGAKLELIFVGSLIPLKACDLALRGAASLLREDLARFTVVGDGPERDRLEHLARSLGVDKAVLFCGWLSHDEAIQQLRSADVLLFPSIRDFGGGVVFEALAHGVVPVVADFGGPGDTVHPGVGCKVSLTNETDVVSQIEEILLSLARDGDRLDQLRHQGVSYAREYLSWDAKAQRITTIMRWVLRQGPKPNLPPPRLLRSERAS
ncbi:glycosyltransferase family 4 protein [Alloacidobacterium dinghuense]|uniref:Glycosyltransferase family 4 protein n=1 Tax=Alloacidobacterium dinghuense TaxID=2763107 RepID=A0A7G8BLS2_9BACT|nr:glycosyltransferase family 4 protein [Alloacidobacterium dinghuense]QNI33492.1 glycosyltransferase family 4 protein [Alloacidobacterium dinghuense]